MCDRHSSSVRNFGGVSLELSALLSSSAAVLRSDTCSYSIGGGETPRDSEVHVSASRYQVTKCLPYHIGVVISTDTERSALYRAAELCIPFEFLDQQVPGYFG